MQFSSRCVSTVLEFQTLLAASSFQCSWRRRAAKVSHSECRLHLADMVSWEIPWFTVTEKPIVPYNLAPIRGVIKSLIDPG